MIKKAVIAPTGGFGHHIRWVLLLDPEYKLTFTIEPNFLEISYNNLKGNDWPEFVNFSHMYDGLEIDKSILKEISEQFDLKKLHDLSKFKSDCQKEYVLPEEKIKFIKKYVYAKDRTWNNWLIYEKTFYNSVNNNFYLHHNDKFDHDLANRCSKILITHVDPKISLKAYIKFNSMLNNCTHDQYEQLIQQSNTLSHTYSNLHSNVLSLDSGLLFQETLNKDFYYQAINWFKQDDFYIEAQELHKHWFLLHKKAENEMIRDLQNLFNN